MIWKHDSSDFCKIDNLNCNLKNEYNYNNSKKINFNNQINEINDIFSSGPINNNSNLLDLKCSSLNNNACQNSKFDILNNIYDSSDLCELKDNKCTNKKLLSNHIYSYSKKNIHYIYKYYKYKNKLNKL